MQIPWRSVHPPVRRAVPSSLLPSATACLLAAQISIFVLQWGIREAVGVAKGDPLLAFGGISADGLRAGHLWQPLTALFVVGGPGAGWLLPWGWLVFALTGRPLEAVIGRRHLVQLYLTAGVFGGLVQVAVLAATHRAAVPVGEATLANCGVIFGLACVLPRAALLPGMARLRGIKMVHGAAGLAGVLTVTATSGAGVQALALGGLAGSLAGCLSMRGLGFGRRVQEAQPQVDFEDESPETVNAPAAAASGKLVVPRFTERERRMTPREYVSEQIDPILEKISRHGLASLTAGERRILDKGREKMSQGGR